MLREVPGMRNPVVSATLMTSAPARTASDAAATTLSKGLLTASSGVYRITRSGRRSLA